MSDETKLLPFEYLLSGSETSLQNAMLHRLADATNRRKELLELLEKWAERKAEAILLEWFLNNGHELISVLTLSLKVTEMQRASEGEKPGPQSAVDFRDRLRSIVESA